MTTWRASLSSSSGRLAERLSLRKLPQGWSQAWTEWRRGWGTWNLCRLRKARGSPSGGTTRERKRQRTRRDVGLLFGCEGGPELQSWRCESQRRRWQGLVWKRSNCPNGPGAWCDDSCGAAGHVPDRVVGVVGGAGGVGLVSEGVGVELRWMPGAAQMSKVQGCCR